MGSARTIRPEEIRMSPVLRRLPENQHRVRSSLLPASQNERGYRFTPRTKIFSTLEAKSGYWKVQIREQGRDITAFT